MAPETNTCNSNTNTKPESQGITATRHPTHQDEDKNEPVSNASTKNPVNTKSVKPTTDNHDLPSAKTEKRKRKSNIETDKHNETDEKKTEEKRNNCEETHTKQDETQRVTHNPEDTHTSNSKQHNLRPMRQLTLTTGDVKTSMTKPKKLTHKQTWKNRKANLKLSSAKHNSISNYFKPKEGEQGARETSKSNYLIGLTLTDTQGPGQDDQQKPPKEFQQ